MTTSEEFKCEQGMMGHIKGSVSQEHRGRSSQFQLWWGGAKSMCNKERHAEEVVIHSKTKRTETGIEWDENQHTGKDGSDPGQEVETMTLPRICYMTLLVSEGWGDTTCYKRFECTGK